MLVGLAQRCSPWSGLMPLGTLTLHGWPHRLVTGVGFLCSGAIFRTGSTVSGLTMAAGLWAVAAIGMAAGAGLVGGAGAATTITFVILYGLGLVEHLIRKRRSAGITSHSASGSPTSVS